MVLTIIYLAFVVLIGVMIVWHAFETDRIYDKITVAITIILLILRLFLLK